MLGHADPVIDTVGADRDNKNGGKGCWLHLLILRRHMIRLTESNYGAAWKELG